MNEWMRSYRKEWLSADVVAGLTAAAVVIPNALAYATVAGLPVEVGLYTAFVPMLIYALVGTSRPLSVSTTTTIAILTGAQLAQVAAAGGGSARVSRRSAWSAASSSSPGSCASGSWQFHREPVLVGFRRDSGCVIVLDQLPKIFIHIRRLLPQHRRDLPGLPGIPSRRSRSEPGRSLCSSRSSTPPPPAPLIAVAAAILEVKVFGLAAQEWPRRTFPRGCPPRPAGLFARRAPLARRGGSAMSFRRRWRRAARSAERRAGAAGRLFATGLANAGGAC